MEYAEGGDGVEARLERFIGGALRQEHQHAIECLEEIRVPLRFEQLESKG